MTNTCYEIVTYKVKKQSEADAARSSAQCLLKYFPGFIDWIALSGTDDLTERVDLVIWNSYEDALTAAKAVAHQPEFSSFRASVSSLQSMGHYVPQEKQTPELIKGCGIEIGRFRLKKGVQESKMREIYSRMVEGHLSLQPGWKSQHLVSLNNGVFVDLAFADSQLCAEAICASWQGQALCNNFLEMIEPESMEFGSIC